MFVLLVKIATTACLQYDAVTMNRQIFKQKLKKGF